MKSFEESSLHPEILHAILDMGFVTPTEVQTKTIPFILDHTQDLIALAQTGTGKTAAFGLPLMSQTNIEKNVPQTLIICPTRELCLQIEKDLQHFCAHLPIKTVAVYGGASIDTQLKALRKGVHFVVATPGRLVDIIKRKKINLSEVQNVVLDESDEMLNMGFQEDIDTILEQTPKTKRTLLFSATMPSNVRRIANKYMHKPEEITVGSKNAGADTVSHHVYMVHSKDRYIALKRIADYYPNIYGIVFCRTRQETKDVAEKLMNDGYNADTLHGDLSQAQRDYVMKKFRNKSLNMLVATDVAARGLDVNSLTHVINYSLPDDIEAYTHRSGRTGRAGKEGISIAIINLREKGKLRQIEKILQKSFEHKQVPHGKEICHVQLMNLISEINNAEVSMDKIGGLYDTLLSSFEHLSKEELIQKFISFEFNRLLEYYENAPDINVSGDARSSDRSKKGDRSSSRGIRNNNYTRFFINIGKKDGVDKPELLRLLNKHVQDRDVHYGAIDILKSFSFFEVESDNISKITSSFKHADFKGTSISVEKAQAPKGKANRGSKNNFIKGDDFWKQKNSKRKPRERISRGRRKK
ncbi:MAG: DEAD/DEAH box helicase [Bacteroidales bacterium]